MQGWFLKYHCDLFLKNRSKYDMKSSEIIPVFIDWNMATSRSTIVRTLLARGTMIGSEWAIVCSILFFSRVVSDIGDRTVFSYGIILWWSRFILFLQEYHKVTRFTDNEIRFMREAYRFLYWNYVIKDGKHSLSDNTLKNWQAELWYLSPIGRQRFWCRKNNRCLENWNPNRKFLNTH